MILIKQTEIRIMIIYDMKTEDLINPIGIDEKKVSRLKPSKLQLFFLLKYFKSSELITLVNAYWREIGRASCRERV